MPNAETLCRDLARIRAVAPLVHNITNFVVMNSTANALLALGASPVMAHAAEEVDEMTGIAKAVVINIGTLSAPWIEAMRMAVRSAAALGKPWVLDPVGAGASRVRTETSLALTRVAPPAVIRGNASEILALRGGEAGTKGVASIHASEAALGAAKALASAIGCVVSVSGEVDLITDGNALIRVANGHPLMPRVTGLGCAATAITGAFAAINPDPLEAAAHAMSIMGMAGEMAMEKAAGPGTLQLHFLDALYAISEADIARRLRMSAG
ncbi:MAG TPA: hydroxyethylthiazole kinase [Candidatus Brocadiia bacterium]|nr:hydroxyethylthiazole kinase [Candidatus Brocadiia bacterium]